MLTAILMGLIGGQRAMTPLATIAVAAARGWLPAGNGAPRIVAHPLVAAGAVALAAAEMVGDKLQMAPDRVAPAGLAARAVTSGVAGAALVDERQRWLGAAVAGSTAILAAYAGWRGRVAAMRYYGQAGTGLIEDLAVLAGAMVILLERRQSAVAPGASRR
jgi:uncharacterized membrane protein